MATSQRIHAVVDLMQARYAQPFDVDDLARIAGLSTSHFSALCKNEVGVSPKQFLVKLRVHKAAQLLSSTTLSIDEVAQRVGYHDQRYFSRCFKKLMGLPPSDFREGQALTREPEGAR